MQWQEYKKSSRTAYHCFVCHGLEISLYESCNGWNYRFETRGSAFVKTAMLGMKTVDQAKAKALQDAKRYIERRVNEYKRTLIALDELVERSVEVIKNQ